MDRKDWTRIGLAAAVVLVPGGFLLGAALAAQRLREKTRGTDAGTPDEQLEDNAPRD
ncbi:hypothetical protein [Sphingomonas sp. 10B4]|uniref:hypothetical protein n=1 Tax=Sphingomonas sp. 10B4 TaxID=3048575 RepID=UPI002AB3F44B|nr:hypothetical protein [Sphingomonas sp. 10B4]MDY7524119.1 hypothetical protein [Sphingomonas sp. 10B4]MEB0281737.1 hypothetical protein [Sphingomonas sp. 10B4]